MTTPQEKEQLLARVLQKYPKFNLLDLETFGRPRVWTGACWVRFTQQRMVERIPFCCGVVEIGGLMPLGKLDAADLALFRLWLDNHCGLDFVPNCYIATTANYAYAEEPTSTEQALFAAGWTPENRGVNNIHRDESHDYPGNHVILWTYKITPDSMYAAFRR
jgi:hypothetical protein